MELISGNELRAPNFSFMDQLPGDSDAQANMVHSIVIGVGGTYKDLYLNWHLVPESKPFIQPPEIKTQYVEIPGSDTELDYTQSLTGKVNYSYRSGSWDFIMVPDGRSSITRYNELCSFLNGSVSEVILRDYDNYRYKGRVWVSSMKSDKMYSKVTISYKLEPHPYVDGSRRSDLF